MHPSVRMCTAVLQVDVFAITTHPGIKETLISQITGIVTENVEEQKQDAALALSIAQDAALAVEIHRRQEARKEKHRLKLEASGATQRTDSPCC